MNNAFLVSIGFQSPARFIRSARPRRGRAARIPTRIMEPGHEGPRVGSNAGVAKLQLHPGAAIRRPLARPKFAARGGADHASVGARARAVLEVAVDTQEAVGTITEERPEGPEVLPTLGQPGIELLQALRAGWTGGLPLQRRERWRHAVVGARERARVQLAFGDAPTTALEL